MFVYKIETYLVGTRIYTYAPPPRWQQGIFSSHATHLIGENVYNFIFNH